MSNDLSQPGTMTVTLPVDLADRIRREANAECRSVSSVLRKAVVKYYQTEDAKKAA
ncbi:MAG: CopG family transcriptional regulator [Streptosporangiaceae bacterium]